MKRSALKRGTKPLQRKARLKARKTPKAFRKRRDPAYQAWIRTLPCLLASARRKESAEWSGGENWHDEWWHECQGRIQAAHIVSRGAGGADVGNELPLCALAHHEQHSIGMLSWARRWGYRSLAGLKYEGRKLAALYRRGASGEDWKTVYARLDEGRA